MCCRWCDRVPSEPFLSASIYAARSSAICGQRECGSVSAYSSFIFCIGLPFFICNGILMVNFSTFNQQSDAIDQNQPNANGQEQQTKFIHHAHVTNYILKFSHFSLLLRSLDRSNKYFVCAVINNTVVSCASSNAPCSMCVFIFIVFTHWIQMKNH